MGKTMLKSRFDPRFSKPYQDPPPEGYDRISVIGENDDTEIVLVAYRQCGGCGGKRHGADCSGLCQDCRAGKEPAAVPQQFQSADRFRIPLQVTNKPEVKEPEVTQPEPELASVSVSAQFVDRVWAYISDETRNRAITQVFPTLPTNIKTMIIEKAMEMEGA